MVSGTTQLVPGLTTEIHGDNVTALYEHGYLAGKATTHQAIKLRQHNNYSNKGARINIERYQVMRKLSYDEGYGIQSII